MPHLTSLGLFHTVIGIIALVLAITSLIRTLRISQHDRLGKLYIVSTMVACITSFGVQKTGHLSPSHFLTVLILLILPAGIIFQQRRFIGKKLEYVGIAAMTFTVFLSFIPTVVETLTRVPVVHPIAENEQSPVVRGLILLLAIIFTCVTFLQLRKASALRRNTL